MFMNMVLHIIGSILIKIFVSSTCVTVHRFHGPELMDVAASVLIIAARSKNLGNRFSNLCYIYDRRLGKAYAYIKTKVRTLN